MRFILRQLNHLGNARIFSRIILKAGLTQRKIPQKTKTIERVVDGFRRFYRIRMIVIIDNYDSFTYNVVQGIEKLGARTRVYRNDAISLSELKELAPNALILSPGPCTPGEAGISIGVVRKFSGVLPILGICLGHQTIVQAFGGRIMHAKQIMHGKQSRIKHDRSGIFQWLPNPFLAGRYHSWVADSNNLPSCLSVCAHSEDGEIMAVSHKEEITIGIQFHPESILTPTGDKLLQNFLDMIKKASVGIN